jgi:hypothetical protein
MDKHLYSTSRVAGSRRTGLVFVFLILFLAPATSFAAGQPATSPRPAVTCVAAPLFGDSWGVRRGIGTAWNFVESGLSDRRRMIQLATIGMCIGLYIMMRR